jgi:DNA mismatch endonuclease (patch repair protein)
MVSKAPIHDATKPIMVTDPPVSPERSHLMAGIRGKNTKIEVNVRRIVHALGYRFRLHRRDLPGTPDIAFPSRRKVIFVHGCFWHQHLGCRKANLPKTRANFWRTKLAENKARDKRSVAALRREGWGVLVVWECEITDTEHLRQTLRRFLDG